MAREAKKLRAATKKFQLHFFQETQTAITEFLGRIAKVTIGRSIARCYTVALTLPYPIAAEHRSC
ncbi:DUF1661 domain-containing protein [Porphyromonas gulae]|uniref:DUF1661 domain-containing protein n=1 Tax=Porphyromonas gulae TaxID=111105 RepID=UPI001F322C6F|nr:DUF1661 domain-containing protein [Porphyromonas gulae]